MTKNAVQMISNAMQSLPLNASLSGGVLSPEQRARRLTDVMHWCMAIAAAIVVAPYVSLLLQGGLGLAVAGVGGAWLINRSKVWSERLAHWRLRSLREEWQTHYLDALEAELLRRHEEYAQARHAVAMYKAALTHARAQARPSPTAPSAGGLPPDDGMEDMLDRALAAADQHLQVFEQDVQDARSSWRMEQAQCAVARAMGRTVGSSFDTLKTNTALQAAQAAAHRSHAQLLMALRQRT